MDRNNIDKIAKNPEDRILLAKLWDKITGGIGRSIPANTGFLSLREQEMSRFLFGDMESLHTFGGYPDAERRMLIYLPDYLDSDMLYGENAPLVCLRASFYEEYTLNHRDFLGALMGAGISRETVGDICVGRGYCDFFVTKEIVPYIEQNLESAGRTKINLQRIPLTDVVISQPETKEIRDTVSSLRLDSIVSSGFRISRSAATDYIAAGKASINGLPCEKPDKIISEGAKISVRGLGKIRLAAINGKTKKDRISIIIERYI